MRAELPYRRLVRTIRAMAPYARPGREWGTGPRLLHLSQRAGVLTVAAGDSVEVGEVDLLDVGWSGDGRCAVGVKSVIDALAALRPRAARVNVTLQADGGTVQLAVDGGGWARLPTEAVPGTPICLSAPTQLLVDAEPAAAVCSVLGQVGAAAAADPAAIPELATVRMIRDAGACLRIEATDRFRVHRASLGEPQPTAVDARMPIAALRRAIVLLRACGRIDSLTIDADAHRIRWQTRLVRLACATVPGDFPDLERLRERVLAAAGLRLVVSRGHMQPALAQAVGAAPAGRTLVIIDPSATTTAVAVADSRGGELYRTSIPVLHRAGPAMPLRFKAMHLREAFALFDGDTVSIHAATIGREPVYFESGDRHAILAQDQSP